MGLTPEQMVQPKSVAPFEVEFALRLWDERWNDTPITGDTWPERQAMVAAAVGGLGPPERMPSETRREWAQRFAVAIFTLIKEC